jgi:hypothetical protein
MSELTPENPVPEYRALTKAEEIELERWKAEVWFKAGPIGVYERLALSGYIEQALALIRYGRCMGKEVTYAVVRTRGAEESFHVKVVVGTVTHEIRLNWPAL